MSYTVFIRCWWRWERNSIGGKRLVPHPRARRTRLATVYSYEDAQNMCEDYNRTHKPGPLSRKAEFTATENY